jgi:hypothetical protein
MKNLALILTAILVSGTTYAQDNAIDDGKSLAEENLIKSQQQYIECIEKFKSDLKVGNSPFYELNVLSRKIPSTVSDTESVPTRYIAYSKPNVIVNVTEHGTMEYSPEKGSTSCSTNICNCPITAEPETIRVLFGKRLKALEDDSNNYDKKESRKIAEILNSKVCSILPEVIALKKEPGGCPDCKAQSNGK